MHLRLTLPSESHEEEDYAPAVAALLHERHHWLQSMGTMAGLFSTLILELQNGVIAGGIPLSELQGEDLPLTKGRFSSSPHLLAWERFEANRRVFWGCRPGNLNKLVKDGRSVEFEVFSDLIEDMLRKCSPNNSELANHIDELWSRFPNDSGPMTIPKGQGWILGARHVMEDAARISEQYRLISYRIQRAGAKADVVGAFTDTAKIFSGIYGRIRNKFHAEHGYRGPQVDLALAFLCDASLNMYYPPVLPPRGSLVTGLWNPAAHLLDMSRHLRGFDLDELVNPVDPEEVRRFIFRLRNHILEQEPNIFHFDAPGAFMERTYGNCAPSKEPGKGDGDTPPQSTSPVSRISHILSESARAYKVRRDAPEFFIFPACRYLADRHDFRRVFRGLTPPLLSYGPSGIGPSVAHQRSFDIFLSGALQAEILRGVVMHDATKIGEKIAPYLNTAFGFEFGAAVAEKVLYDLFGADLASKLLNVTIKMARESRDSVSKSR